MLSQIPQIEKMSKTHFYESKPKFNKFNNHGNGNKQQYHHNQKKPYYTFDPIEKEESKEETKQCPKFTNSKTNNGIKLKSAPEYKPKTTTQAPSPDDFIITDLSEPSITEVKTPEAKQELPADKFSELGGQTENSNAMNAQVQIKVSDKKENFSKPVFTDVTTSSKTTSNPKFKADKKKKQTHTEEETPTLPKSTRFSRF